MGSAEFEIRESLESGLLRLTLLGELDLAAAPELEARLEKLRGEGRAVLMDLSQLKFMDSSGLAIMTRAINISRSNGWALVVDSDLSAQVRGLFRLTAMDHFVGVNGYS